MARLITLMVTLSAQDEPLSEASGYEGTQPDETFAQQYLVGAADYVIPGMQVTSVAVQDVSFA